MTIRVVLVDDHQLFRDGIRALLSNQPDLEVVADADNAERAIAVIDATKPDVIVLDLAMPGVPGFTVLREVKRRALQGRILVLTMHAGEAHVADAFAVGAAGYALKQQPADEVIDAIRAVHEGRLYLAPTIPRAALEGARGGAAGGPGKLAELSAREREVFDLLVRNQSNKEVAETLGISVKTVETHRMSINRKLDVHSTAELIRFAAIGGLLPG